MPEDRPTISSARLAAGDVARHTFMTVRRGFDPQEVRSFLDLVARELQAWEQRDLDLRRQLGDVEERARHPVLDEATLTAALGQQSAQVLRSAHDESRRVVEEAEANAASVQREAKRQADDTLIRAESAAAERIAEAELAASAMRQQADHESAAAAEAGRAGGDALVAEARDRGRRMIEQAQQARRRILTDMAQRRRVLHVQIEQLRAARDELAASVLAVRSSVDRILSDLARADDDARAAAAEVARRPPPEPPLGDEVGGGGVEDAVAIVGPEEPSAVAETAEDAVAPADLDPAVVEGPGRPPPATETVAPADPPAVDALFARLRQTRGVDPTAPTVAPAGERGSGSHPDDVTPAHGVRVLGPDVEPPSPYDQSGTAEAAPVGSEPSGAVGPAPADAVLVEARATLLGPVTAKLSRRVKRALQDDQNHLLDRIRSASPKSTDSVLASQDEQLAPLVAAGAPLQEAADAGRRFALDQGATETASSAAVDSGALAEELARAIVTPLRRRLEGSDQGVEGVGLDEAAERVHAAYREWRGERVERLVGDVAVQAFSAGAAAAAGPSSLRWVPAGPGPACADCDDNALGGPVAAGSAFPTGHRHPPAHAGCRCLVTLAPN